GSHAIEITPVIKAGYDVGGDTVVSVNVGGSTKTIKANDGFFVGGGASFLSDSKVLEIEVSLSYKFFNIVAQDGERRERQIRRRARHRAAGGLHTGQEVQHRLALHERRLQAGQQSGELSGHTGDEPEGQRHRDRSHPGGFLIPSLQTTRLSGMGSAIPKPWAKLTPALRSIG